MPSKIQLDENLWFLYICLQKSDVKAIDFNAVGVATSLKPPAARMRYTRLKRQIESGSLNLAHGPGFSSSPPPPTSPTLQPEAAAAPTPVPPSKRKRGKKAEDANTSVQADVATAPAVRNEEKRNEKGKEKPVTSATSTLEHPNPSGHALPDVNAGVVSTKPIQGKEDSTTKIKLENHSGSDADFNSDSEDDEASDSEDEMPLAKLRKRRDLGLSLVPLPSVSSAVSSYAPVPASLDPASVYSTYASSHDAYFGSGCGSSDMNGSGNGNENGNEDASMPPRYVPQDFNALAIASGRGFDGQGFGGGGHAQDEGRGGGRGRDEGQNGRALYASPYAGWIDGRGHEDRMGDPGPGWDHFAMYQGLQHQEQQQGMQQRIQSQRQPQELERGLGGGNEAPRKSV